MKLRPLLWHLLAGGAAAALLLIVDTSWALEEGFEDQEVAKVSKVTAIAFATHWDGTELMYCVTKRGQLYVITRFEEEDSDPRVKEILDMSDEICDDRERGIHGVEVHPDFVQNGYIYMYYTWKRGNTCEHSRRQGPVNRLSRWVIKDDYSIDKDSEYVLLDTPPLLSSIHNAGNIEFGVDKMLYITLGDDDQRSEGISQDRTNIFGSMLRLRDDGSVPDDNPFMGSGTAPCAYEAREDVAPDLDDDKICQEIFAYGLRNPFRFTMDPHSTDKVRFYINDVGAKMWEESNVGGVDYAGANYGWPTLEGPCKWDRDSNCPVYEEFTDPFFWYEHNSAREGAAVGIFVVPKGTNWPQKYHQSIFVDEYIDGKIWHLEEDVENFCRECTPPRPGWKATTFHRHERAVDFQFGPYKSNQKALYYTSRSESINIRRIVYKGSDNNAPVADFSVSQNIVEVGGTIEFDASETFDPDYDNMSSLFDPVFGDDMLSFDWDFGDGSPLASGEVVQHTFESAGTYEVELTVEDDAGFTDSERKTVTVGDPPEVKILSPPDGTMFAVDDRYFAVGEGTDSEGNALASSSLSWEVRQHHGTHWHPFFSGVGDTASLPRAPKPEDFHAASNSYLEILLTGTDTLGLSTTVSRNISPKTVWLDFDTIPTNLIVSLDLQEIITPERILSWENHKLHVLAPNQGDYKFVSWSNGLNQTDQLTVPTGISGTQEVPRYVATFASTLTLEPSARTSSQPSTAASATPTWQPSVSPSANPSSRPSASPSANPTPSPTAEPSSRPSVTPSSEPSVSPTSIPSGFPSFVPTSKPSAAPSKEPSETPSVMPSLQPSAIPSMSPSSQPSIGPSGMPTTQPTGSLQFRRSAANVGSLHFICCVLSLLWSVLHFS